MIKEFDFILSPQEAFDENIYTPLVLKKLQLSQDRVNIVQIIRRSIDARSKNIKVNLKLQVVFDEPTFKNKTQKFNYQNVSHKPEIVIVGSGPAGLFAALKLIELGLKPIIVERGKNVSDRKIDIAAINRDHIINPDSNYCFGEGGAGTFSDGKLYTRSKKRGDVDRILQIFHHHGADKNILYETHPHIGTNRLPEIIKNIRNTIIEYGGEIHFNTRICDFIIEDNQIKGVTDQNNNQIIGQAVILSTGHSARDIYELLKRRSIQIESKAFAMGVRVEHPQQLIDSIQYHCKDRGDYLPAANYNLVQQIKDRGVYSFCMCPGGFIVPAATGIEEVVVNGMSPAARNSQFANSGIVVEIKLEDLQKYSKHQELSGLKYQQDLESFAFNNGLKNQTAPAQRLSDFTTNKTSSNLPDSSYIPGIISSSLHNWLPKEIRERLQLGFKEFDRKMKGFLTNEAVILGVESRTSSPVRIPRNLLTLEHPQIKKLYPCGEGAGYAGGIASSAIDGENCAKNIADSILK